MKINIIQSFICSLIFIAIKILSSFYKTTRKSDYYFFYNAIDIVLDWRRILSGKCEALMEDLGNIEFVCSALRNFKEDDYYCSKVMNDKENEKIIAEFIFADDGDAKLFDHLLTISNSVKPKVSSTLQNNKVIIEIKLENNKQ